MGPLNEHWWPNAWFEEFLGVSWWCPISLRWFDICGWPVEDIWVTYGNLAKDQWTHWVNIGDPMNGLKNPWVFPGGAQLFLGVLTYVGDLWNKYDKWVKINNFLGAPVLFYLAYLLTSSDILSGISSDILSGTLSGISSDILSGISSDILSGISSDILSGISSDIFWHSFWHSIWHIFWHSIWHIFWHSIWHIFWYLLTVLSGTLSGISSDSLSGISSDILSGISSDIFWQFFWHSIWHIFWHSIWHIFWHSIWHIFWYLLTVLSGTLSRAMKQHITDHNSTCMHMSSPLIYCHILSSIFQIMVQNLSWLIIWVYMPINS